MGSNRLPEPKRLETLRDQPACPADPVQRISISHIYHIPYPVYNVPCPTWRCSGICWEQRCVAHCMLHVACCPEDSANLLPNVTTAVPLILFAGGISHSRTSGLSLNQCTSDAFITYFRVHKKKMHFANQILHASYIASYEFILQVTNFVRVLSSYT